MKAVIHQPLGDVLHLDAGGLFPRAHIKDELVRDEIAVAAIKHLEVRRKLRGHVVRVEDGDLRRALEALPAEHGDIHPRDDQDARAAPRRRADRALRPSLFARCDDHVAGKIIR